MKKIEVYKNEKDMLNSEIESIEKLIKVANKIYTPVGVHFGEKIAHNWFKKNETPYLDELADLKYNINKKGIYLLNHSYEWGCTSGVGVDFEKGGSRLLRTLDWPFKGLGEEVKVLKRQSKYGEFFDITWVGFTGCLTVMAPGRFSISINKPPTTKTCLTYPTSWLRNKLRMLKTKEIPAAHLLRRVCEEAKNYKEAVEMLSQVKTAVPVFFSISGVNESECCVIEKDLNQFHVTEQPTAIANKWVNFDIKSYETCKNSECRRQAMIEAIEKDTEWEVAPIINKDTRLAFYANAKEGIFTLTGYEDCKPVTEKLNFS